ncbi:MAG: DNA polymerase III subunit gamma/tau [Alphaproteobacteria bacterium]|nr:DNA polymerase III subunit gamma/tau [Alphaproteobacteria bacterium]
MNNDSEPVASTPELFGGGAAPPPYRVLARKYRPQDFDALIGQDALVRTLTNAFATGRIAHAFMLTGVRGVGKTSTARIIAKALNCTGADGKGGPTVKPCGVCYNCRAIAEDRHVDVLEMDAASHTGVDNMREILDGTRYRPVMGRAKVYIIDEVHMLSKVAFNALLKTLEEPPPHVKFIFATTETRKVPVTVLSRCQRFDLHRIETARLVEHLAAIAKREEVTAEDMALRLIARAADGSARDALSLLDQAIAHGDGKVEGAAVRAMLGLAEGGRVLELADTIFRGDAKAVLGLLRRLYDSGAEPLTVLQDLLDLTHWLTRLLLAPEEAASEATSDEERAQGKAMAAKLSVPLLSRAWQIQLKGLSEVQAAPSPIDAAEMVLVRLCFAAALPTPAEMIARLDEKAAMASPAPAATATRPKESTKEPSSFAEIVALFGLHKEARLRNELYHHVEPVALVAGRLEIRLRPQAPRDLPARVQERLRAWLGAQWQVALAAAGASVATLAEAERVTAEERKAQAAEHPLVKATLEAFPGATIVRVRALDGGAGEGVDAAESDLDGAER